MLHYLYVDKALAIEIGATHEGTFFWVPAWFVGNPDGEVFNATPKFPICHAWWWLADKFCDLATYCMREDQSFEIPLTVKRKI